MRTRMMRLLMLLALLLSLTSLPAGAAEPFAAVGEGGHTESTYSPSIGAGMPISNINGTGNVCSYGTVNDLRGTSRAMSPQAYNQGGVWHTKSFAQQTVVGSNGLDNFTIDMCGLLYPPATVTDPGWDPQRHGPTYCAMLGHSGLGWVRFDAGPRLRLFDLGWKVEGLITGYYQEHDAAGVAQDRWGTITINQAWEIVQGLRPANAPGGCGYTSVGMPLVTFTPLNEEP